MDKTNFASNIQSFSVIGQEDTKEEVYPRQTNKTSLGMQSTKKSKEEIYPMFSIIDSSMI